MSGPQPIALQDILAYAGAVGYHAPDDALFLAEIVNACDQVYINKSLEKQKAEVANQKLRAKSRK